MSFDSQERPQGKPHALEKTAEPSTPGVFGATVVSGLSHFGWLDDVRRGVINGLSGWGMNPAQAETGAKDPNAKAGVLAEATKQSKGETQKLSPALQAASSGATVAEQAAQVSGPVTMTAAQALNIAGQLSPEDAARQRIQEANQGDGGYQSPFVSVALSGIRNDQEQAEGISTAITGDQTPHGYAAYGKNDKSYKELTGGDGIVSPGDKSPKGLGASEIDTANDVAAVTQYAAAAELGIKLTPNENGGKTVAIDWEALSQMEVSADLGALGGKIAYDKPSDVAQNGYQAVMAEIAERGGKPEDKEQFISLTGHSGGGQSSFYTALKLASEGYKNISLVGVDMAISPHEREVLEALGVNVTNITSNNKDDKGTSTSEIGDVIRVGMGGGQNFYDLNVERQNAADPLKRHDIANDPNVATTVRYAQYLDSIGKHGQYSPEMYEQFLKDTGGKGNQAAGGVADQDLLSKITDQRGLPGPGENSTDIGQGASFIEDVINLLGGKGVTDAIKDAGQSINNTVDKAGDSAGSWIGGLFGKAGDFLGGMANQGLDWLGGGVSAIGGLIGNGLDKVGDFAQGAAGMLGDGVSWLGGMANQGLDWLGGGISSIGGSVQNGLDGAGDTAKSWLGGIPLVGGFLGDVADTGLDLLGGGIGTVSGWVGGGLDAVGDVAQGGGNLLSDGLNWLGGAANSGLDMLGGGISSLGGWLGNGLDAAGDMAQSGIGAAFDTVGGWAGGLVNGGIDLVGNGIGGLFNLVGDFAGGAVRTVSGPLVRYLQGVGIDTSLIPGLDDFDGTNPSVQRGWQDKLSDPNDPSKVQKIDVPGPSPSTAPDQQPAMPPAFATQFKDNIDDRLAATQDLKPEQRERVQQHIADMPVDSIAPVEMAAVDRALRGPNADRAMGAYADLIKMQESNPEAQERLSPEIMAMLVSGVGDRRTDSDRGQAGILGQRQARDAAQSLLNMSEADYAEAITLLEQAGKDKDGKPIPGADPRAEQALILKAMAARRDNVAPDPLTADAQQAAGITKHDQAFSDINQFAADIRGTPRADLIRTTTLMDIDDENTSTVDPDNTVANSDTRNDNDGLYQRYNDSCAPTTQQILRGEMDPVYALRRHRQGIDNPDSETEVAREQGDTLAKHGGDSTLRQGDHARNALGDQITSAGLTAEQTQTINDLATGAKLDPTHQQQAEEALKLMRAKNDGHPTQGEIASMRANAANPNSTRTGVWQGDAAKELSNDVTHLNLTEQNIQGSGGIGPHLANVETALKDGQPVPFNVAWDHGGVHAMMLTDVRTDTSGSKTYLVTDPWTGATRWVGQKELTDGTWYQNRFGGDTSTFQDLVSDPQSPM